MQPEAPHRTEPLLTQEIDDDDENEIEAFEKWISAIEHGNKKFFTILDIKNMITEAGSLFGRKNKILLKNDNQETLDKLYKVWFGSSAGEDEDPFKERDEVCIRLRDMMEAEQNPIADCKECDDLGKVCFENDGGQSHRLSMGKLSRVELNKMSFAR